MNPARFTAIIAASVLCIARIDGALAAEPSAAQRAFIDPFTKKLRAPTAEERAQMTPQMPAKREVQEYVLPDGTHVLPAEANLHHLEMRRAADGSLQAYCHDHVDEVIGSLP